MYSEHGHQVYQISPINLSIFALYTQIDGSE
jgi:hypothetical protein